MITVNDLLLIADSVGACRLTRVEGGAAVRTRETEGVALNMPILGEPFFMRATPLEALVAEEGQISGRLINTSPLTEILMLADDQGLLLTTASGSKYLLEAIRR